MVKTVRAETRADMRVISEKMESVCTPHDLKTSGFAGKRQAHLMPFTAECLCDFMDVRTDFFTSKWRFL